MKNLIFVTLLFAISFVSCERECNENLFTSNSDYLIFGHFYGECFGEKCIEIYKLDNTHLFEDTTDVYPSTTNFYDGSYVQLSQQKFESSRDIMNYFPSDLLNEPNIVIGQPDAADGEDFMSSLILMVLERFG
ncbi:MAG: hypothetical protein KBA06_02535 [Saprospiraceae bacterium]|nr:hypothetical protein [Saprospiraceae bacterium]